MENADYRTVCLEGGDQVGKADASSVMISKLESEGVNLTYTSFPIYSTPVGSTIRTLLKEGSPEDVLSAESDLNVRMALFALNRLEFLDVFLNDDKYSNTLLLLDRSPYSNALTIAYGLSEHEDWENEKVQALIEKSLDYDSFMIHKLGLDNCVVQLKSNASNWKNIRKGETDTYEEDSVQERCDDVYEMYKGGVGDSWHEIVTKDDSGWRDREEICGDISDAIFNKYGIMSDIRQGETYNVGFKEIVKSMYPMANYDRKTYSIYSNALKSNQKDLMYSNGVKLGQEVANSCINIRFKNKEIRDEYRRIVLELPEILSVFQYTLGRSYVGKLMRALDL